MANNINVNHSKANNNKKWDINSINEISLEEAIKNLEIESGGALQTSHNPNVLKTSVSRLQELLVRYHISPTYELLECTRTLKTQFGYKVSIKYKAEDISATGYGDSKKDAKHAAAKELIDKLADLSIFDGKINDISFSDSEHDLSSSNVSSCSTQKSDERYQTHNHLSPPDTEMSFISLLDYEHYCKTETHEGETKQKTEENIFELEHYCEPKTLEQTTSQQIKEQSVGGNESFLPQKLSALQKTFENSYANKMKYCKPVSMLQELLARHNIVPKYELVRSKGPVHNSTFCYRLSFCVGENYISEVGIGNSKRDAREIAAKAIISKMFLSGNNINKIKEIDVANINIVPKVDMDYEVIDEKDDLFTKSSNVKCDVNTTFETDRNILVPECKQRILSEENFAANPIGVLQEICVAKHFSLPIYEMVSAVGEPHLKQFTFVCTLGKYNENGCGYNKKEAKRNAAFKMLQRLKAKPADEYELNESCH